MFCGTAEEMLLDQNDVVSPRPLRKFSTGWSVLRLETLCDYGHFWLSRVFSSSKNFSKSQRNTSVFLIEWIIGSIDIKLEKTRNSQAFSSSSSQAQRLRWQGCSCPVLEQASPFPSGPKTVKSVKREGGEKVKKVWVFQLKFVWFCYVKLLFCCLTICVVGKFWSLCGGQGRVLGFQLHREVRGIPAQSISLWPRMQRLDQNFGSFLWLGGLGS